MKNAKMYPNIEAERARQNMTIGMLANYLGISRKTYYNWCSKGAIPQTQLIKMADLFGVTTDYLLGLSAIGGGEILNGKV